MTVLPRSRSLLLFVALLASMAAFPFAAEHSLGRSIVGVTLTLIPLAGLHALSDSRRHLIAGTVLALPAMGVWLRSALTGDAYSPTGATSIVLLAYYGVTTALILVHVMRGNRVTADTLFGAASVYLLMGIAFATAFMAIQARVPGSFAMSGTVTTTFIPFPDMVYYSFVTLTTLGYGDITPLSPHARALAIIEAVTGVFYLTILVARLVGLLQIQSAEGED